MSRFKLQINGQEIAVEAPDDMPLLWVLRDELGLTGTKYGCGIGQCGACTVHLNGSPVRSCMIGIAAASQTDIRTIEGLTRNENLHAVQQSWIDHDVAQCGYCQAGQIMSAVALLEANPSPDDSDIDRAMSGNYCRCGTYIRIRAAIHDAANYYNAAATRERS